MPRPLRPQPLWLRVDQNRVRLAVFVAAFVAGSALLLASAFVGVPGALIGALVFVAETVDPSAYARGFGVTFVSATVLLLALGGLLAAVQLSNAEDWIRSRFGAAEPPSGQALELRRVSSEMAIAAGVTPPRVLVIETEGVNAGGVGLNRSKTALFVTRGMLDTFDEQQLRAVVSTLMARVVSGDILYGTALAALMGPLRALRDWRRGTGVAADAVGEGCSSGLGDSCGCLFDSLGDSDSLEGCAGAVGMAAFAAVVIALTYAAVVTASWIVTVWGRMLHRTGHEKADAEGMLLLKDPSPMLSALQLAVGSSNRVADGDPSYDGMFYVPTSGTPAIERVEQRRYDRLREVLATDGLAAPGVDG